ncbi:MAG: pseudouridine synthase [bacterium]|nr:pseudouridine synthase [bacterium]
MRSYALSRIRSLIVFEDDAWIVRNKPAGIVTHPGTNHQTDMSLHDIMQSYLQQIKQQSTSPTFHPAFCFRLDKDTSGVIISAKTYEALQRLNQQIRERKVQKTYLTIVSGHPPKHLEMTQALNKGYDKQFGVAKMYIEKTGKDSLTIAHCRQQLTHPVL